METLRFKTTIKCSGCISNVTPFMNKVAGENNWEVDVANPEKILSVVPDNGITGNDIIKAVEEAGYKATKIDRP